MAQSFVTDSGTLIIPGAVSKISVQRQNSGVATSGIIALVGEADAGPRFSEESDLEIGATFGPDEAAAVVSKYGGGQLVDAYRAAAQPSNDPNIVGAPSRLILVKTNASTKASVGLDAVGGGTYATLYAKLAGRAGNQLYMTVAQNTPETLPTSGSFTWINNVSSLNMNVRLNGGAALLPTIGANTSPTAFVSALDGLTGVAATGGGARTTIQASVGTLAVAVVSGTSINITYAGSTFTTTPSVGDTVVIPAGSVIDDATVGNGSGDDANVGAYVVTAATTTVISCTKLSDAGKTQGGSPVPGTITAPVAIAAQSVSGTVANDLIVYAPVVVTVEAGAVVAGIGKSLELAELSTGTDLLSRYAFALSTTAVTWVSKTGVAKLLTSSSEYSTSLNLTRQFDAVSEELVAGGELALSISYSGTTATVTTTATALTTSISGGSGSNLSLVLADYSTLADLAAYINAQTGYKASVTTTTLGQLPPTALDRVAAQGICSTWGAKNGRVKIDAYRFFKAISGGSAVADLNSPVARAAAGLPAVMATTTYFTSGARGSTQGSDITAGMDALERVGCNFVVTCFSRDSAADIADGLTDSSSSYSVSSVNAYLKSHCLAMSKLKRKRNRQGIGSIQTTFTLAREEAANLASFRTALTFQDVKTINSVGTLQQFQPWMGAAVAAGMQTAGFYRAIVHKFANLSGAVMADASFSDRDDTQVENALLSGLLPLKRHPNGGFYWVSDQTTYSKDDNFVYNSLQAVYAADIIALTTAQRMEDAFVGQSVADVSASAALTFLEGIMADFRRLKLIAASDDAPAGFRAAKITISGSAMIVEVEIKLAGALYFIPVSFLVSPVQQQASQG